MSGIRVNTIPSAALNSNPFAVESTPSIDNPHRPLLSATFVFLSDFLGLFFMLKVFLLATADTSPETAHLLQFWPILLLFLTLYCLCGFYPGTSVSPVDEVKRISIANASAFIFVSWVLALHRAQFSLQLECLAMCAGVAITLFTLRSAVRKVGSKFRWWGYPVALFGNGDAALFILRKLKSQPWLGLNPVVLVTDQIPSAQLEGVTVCRFRHLHRISSSGVRHAVVAAPELSERQFGEVLEHSGNAFPHVIIIPDTHFVWKADSYTRHVTGGVLGLQVRNNLLCRKSRLAKRVIDLAFCAAMLPALLPLMAIIALAIAIESGFPLFYSQKRLGHGGRAFRIWKLRTMVRNASEVLQRTLNSDPDLRKEWAENHKLRNDPRITRVGRLLRRTSLDELPQLWNVVKGDMSLVGPRPIVEAEIARYHDAYSTYRKTIPGLTGLWQVSGRNRTTYAERVAYDTYYVRNWSVWLDIYLLLKTVTVVLTGYGAY
jgi:Undecaprenyl-phosphate galactose phosphotransferase WbaP